MPSGRDERLWLSGAALVTLASWGGRALSATGSLKVDESYPGELPGTVLFVVALGGWALLVAGWVGLLRRPTATPRRLAYAGLALASLALPMLSNDVFSLLAYGSRAAHGVDVYRGLDGPLGRSPWLPWLGARWAATVCVYGPTTLLASMPGGLADGHAWLGLVLLRLTWLAPLVAVMELSFRRSQVGPGFHAMLWLNPLWIVEGPGQLHGDLLGVVAVTAGVLLVLDGKGLRGWALACVAMLGKYTRSSSSSRGSGSRLAASGPSSRGGSRRWGSSSSRSRRRSTLPSGGGSTRSPSPVRDACSPA